jgi:signal transduction protein with GAF and PtsI domain
MMVGTLASQPPASAVLLVALGFAKLKKHFAQVGVEAFW